MAEIIMDVERVPRGHVDNIVDVKGPVIPAAVPVVAAAAVAVDLAYLCPEGIVVIPFVFADIDLIEDILGFFVRSGAGADLDIYGDLWLIPGSDRDVTKLIVYLQLIFGCNGIGAIDELGFPHIFGFISSCGQAK
jgi:hypothetical protein